LVVAFALLGTQAFASPPIQPPVEGFIIDKSITVVLDPGIDGKSSFSESESFSWTYFEGWGSGPFYPNGYTPVGAGCLGSVGSCPECGPTNCLGLVSELGFTEGAEIRYEQTLEAGTGHLEFTKTFAAKSEPEAGDNNLVVNKKIEWASADPTSQLLKHTERVGLSVISMGAGDRTVTNTAKDLLSLCPWQEGSSSNTGGAYPPTNESIAAGSSLTVSRLVGYESNSVVNSSISPALKYDLNAVSGDGTISTGFIVDLWEGPAGYVWAPIPLYSRDAEGVVDGINTCCVGLQCWCNQRAIIQNGFDPFAVWQLPQQAYGAPPTASRLNYEESTTASGTWSFQWAVSYETSIPGVASPASASAFPNVP
jgi:hypothetical protein